MAVTCVPRITNATLSRLTHDVVEHVISQTGAPSRRPPDECVDSLGRRVGGEPVQRHWIDEGEPLHARELMCGASQTDNKALVSLLVDSTLIMIKI